MIWAFLSTVSEWLFVCGEGNSFLGSGLGVGI